MMFFFMFSLFRLNDNTMYLAVMCWVVNTGESFKQTSKQQNKYSEFELLLQFCDR